MSTSEDVDVIKTSIELRTRALQQGAVAASSELTQTVASLVDRVAAARTNVIRYGEQLAPAIATSQASLAAEQAELRRLNPFVTSHEAAVFGLAGGHLLESSPQFASLANAPSDILPSFRSPPGGRVFSSGPERWLQEEQGRQLGSGVPVGLVGAHERSLAAARLILDLGDPEGVGFAEALLGEALSIRQFAEGRATSALLYCETTTPDRFVAKTSTQPQGDGSRCASAVVPVVLGRQSALERRLQNAEALHRQAATQTPGSSVSLRGLAELLQVSKWNLSAGRPTAAREIQDLCEQILDVLTGTTPGFSTFRDVLEATVGVDLITGRALSTEERVLAAWSVFTLGIGRQSRWIFGASDFGREATRRIGPVSSGIIKPLEVLEINRHASRPLNQLARRVGEDRSDLLRRFGAEGTAFLDKRPGSVDNLNIVLRHPSERGYIRVTLNPTRDTIISAGLIKNPNSIKNRLQDGSYVRVVGNP